ncbi:beta-ketoacyl synthase family protein [Actinoalloteichus sp. GBA129-24]|nr:beta-ketoacyl synthase family protein [Actinoalloteichus sp. GBA129-24]
MPVAVVGMACRSPGGILQQWWRRFGAGHDAGAGMSSGRGGKPAAPAVWSRITRGLVDTRAGTRLSRWSAPTPLAGLSG